MYTSGEIPKKGISPFVGDEVMIDEINNYILDILPRRNYLLRPNVSNVDIVLIVSSLVSPNLSLHLLDKQLCHIYLHNIKPVICFTKLDLASKEEINNLEVKRREYENIGIKTFTNEEIPNLLKYLENKVIVLTGQSGVGKSSLLNKISPKLNLQTNEISLSLNRGKHTTRHTEIYAIKNCFFCDTPGFSSLEFSKYTKEEIKNSFPEFTNYSCRFNDCFHNQELNCGVKEAVNDGYISSSRYQNYLEFLKEGKK